MKRRQASRLRPLIAGLIGLVLMYAPAGAALAEQAAARSILVVYENGNEVHEEVFATLQETLQTRLEVNATPQIRTASPDAPRNAGQTAPDLIVTIGVRAAESQHRPDVAAPILSVLLPKAAYRVLSGDFAGTSSAIYLDQPLERQFAVARALLPRAGRAGMLRGPGAQSDAPDELSTPRTFGLQPNTTRLQADEDPADAIQALLAENDVVIATFDPEVYKPATAKWLLYLAFQQRRPIIGFSSALLRAGAVAAVFSTPAQIGAHAADVVVEWLRDGRLPTTPAYPRYFNIGINAPVAAKLGLGRLRQAIVEQAVRTMLETPP